MSETDILLETRSVSEEQWGTQRLSPLRFGLPLLFQGFDKITVSEPKATIQI